MEDRALIQIIPLLWRHKVFILSSVLLAGIVSSMLMLMKPNFYRSSTLFYPVNSALLEPSVQIQNRPINYYGDDRDVDRLLSIGKSSELAQKIIDDFNLAIHYDIDDTNKKGQIRLFKKFKKLFSIQKTEFDAIELSIEDEDPEIAQQMTLAMRDLINQKAHSIIEDSKKRLLENLITIQIANRAQIQNITDSLNFLRQEYGIYDSKSQAEALATLEINSPGSRSIQSKIDNYSAGISRVMNLEALQQELNEGLAKVAQQVQQIDASLKSDNPPIHIIEDATLPLEKSRPKRSIYVLASMVLIGFLSIILVLFKQQLSSIQFDS